MAPALDVASSNLKRGSSDGISLTKTDYKGGKHPYVKFWWSYHDKSPEKFVIIIFEVRYKKWYEDGKYRTKRYGNYKGQGKVDLDDLHVPSGKYTLRLVHIGNYDDVYAESKPFWID